MKTRNICEPLLIYHCSPFFWLARLPPAPLNMRTISLCSAQLASCALLLQIGGNFVLKFFGSTDKLTRDMFYHLAVCFEQFDIYKPVSSRPASAERYAVFRNYLGGGDVDYLLGLFSGVGEKNDSLSDNDNDNDNNNDNDNDNDNDSNATPERQKFNDFLTYIDTKMAQLNLESLTMILSLLEDGKINENDSNTFCLGPHVVPDVQEYRYALALI